MVTREQLEAAPEYARTFCVGCLHDGGRNPGDYRTGDDGLLHCRTCGGLVTLARIEPGEYEAVDVSDHPGVKCCYVRSTHVVTLAPSEPVL